MHNLLDQVAKALHRTSQRDRQHRFAGVQKPSSVRIPSISFSPEKESRNFASERQSLRNTIFWNTMAWKMHFSGWQGQRRWCQAGNLHRETNFLLEVMIILSHTPPKFPLKRQEKTTLRKKKICVARVKHRSCRPLKFHQVLHHLCLQHQFFRLL